MAFKSFANVKSLSKVSKVLCRFAPNDLRAVGTKEFWRRIVNSETVRLSNEDCTIETDMTGVADPSVEFHFDDGDQLSLSTADFKWQDIAVRLNQRRRQKIIYDETKEMDPDFAKFYKETQDIVNETLMKEGGILVQEITGDDDDLTLMQLEMPEFNESSEYYTDFTVESTSKPQSE